MCISVAERRAKHMPIGVAALLRRHIFEISHRRNHARQVRASEGEYIGDSLDRMAIPAWLSGADFSSCGSLLECSALSAKRFRPVLQVKRFANFLSLQDNNGQERALQNTTIANTANAITNVASHATTLNGRSITWCPMIRVREPRISSTIMIGTAITPLITAL
jgi:hypothetical protein